jgi:probable HAF family extracellular repeat protein
MMKRSMFFLCMMFTVILGRQAQAAPLYQVTAIGSADSQAFNINNAGQVVGQLNVGGVDHAFFHDGTTLVDIGAQSAERSVAYGINDSGVVVGAMGGLGTFQAFRYASGVLSSLALPSTSFALGINKAGVIVGAAGFAEGTHAVTYDEGVVTDLGLLPGSQGSESVATAINSAGTVVGRSEIYGSPNRPTDPFLYVDGAMQNLGNFGGLYGSALAINDHGQIVGAAGAPNEPGSPNLYPRRAFLYDAGGLHDLGTLLPGGDSIANDINNLGQIVGFTDTVNGDRGFLMLDGAMTLLDTLIDTASGWTISEASAINELQQIAATGCKDGVCYAVRLDLAAAIPEPQPVILLVAGMSLLVLARTRIMRAQTNNPRTKRGSVDHGSMRNAQTI